MTEEQKNVLGILKDSLWSGEALDIEVPDKIINELRMQTVDGLASAVVLNMKDQKYLRAAQFAKMVSTQAKIIDMIQQDEIPVVVLKGTASGVYYPAPYLRRYGDIDILVHPDNYHRAMKVLLQKGCVQVNDVGDDVAAFYLNGFEIELHQHIPGLERVKEGAYIQEYLLSGLEDIQKGRIDNPKCEFPMLPWQQNGLELIWHIRVHLYNGIGLRHIIDWMMFVYRHLRREECYMEYKRVLDNAGLTKLAEIVTKMCQVYLGLDGEIRWCKEANEELCAELMEYILEQGNFGRGRKDDKLVKILTKYRTPALFFEGMNQRGLRRWSLARKCVFLRPFAWIYTAIEGVDKYLKSESNKRLLADWNENNRRRELFDQLYDGEYETRLVSNQHGLRRMIPSRAFMLLRKLFKPYK